MKRLISFIICIVTLFIFTNDLRASEIKHCTYKLASQNLTATMKIQDGEAERPSVIGSIKQKDDIYNWDEALEGTSFVGKTYFENNNNNCPPYFYILKIDRFIGHSYRFYVSDEGDGSSFANQINKKYKLKEGFPKILPLLNSEEQIVDEEKYNATLNTSCLTLTNEDDCKRGYKDSDGDGKSDNGLNFSCVWNKKDDGTGYCNTDNLVYVKCGDVFDIPSQVPSLFAFFVNLLKIATPIILIIVSIILLLKALAASNEDEIKKAQKSLIRKVIAAVMVFFVISIVQFVVLKVADTDNSKGTSEVDNLSNCLSCFLNNDCEGATYYKTMIGGVKLCTGIEPGSTTTECIDN